MVQAAHGRSFGLSIKLEGDKKYKDRSVAAPWERFLRTLRTILSHHQVLLIVITGSESSHCWCGMIEWSCLSDRGTWFSPEISLRLSVSHEIQAMLFAWDRALATNLGQRTVHITRLKSHDWTLVRFNADPPASFFNFRTLRPNPLIILIDNT